jgi:hypothetical protein
VSDDEAARLADNSLRDFIASMAAAGNPGSDRHEVGMHKIRGWILEYDPTIGGSPLQAVIGIDGFIVARRTPRSQRTSKRSASEWALRAPHDADPIAGATAFADRLSRILVFNGVIRDDLQGN